MGVWFVSALPSPSQAMVYHALCHPEIDTQIKDIRNTLRTRYESLKSAVSGSELQLWPYNSAFFALVHSPKDPEIMRKSLLTQGVGLVSFPAASALRLSYSTVAASDLPELINRIEKVLLA